MPKTVLIVDDDPTQRRLLTAMIEREGFKVQTADCGDTALNMATDRKSLVDIVLLDMIMPGMSGQETLEALKAKRPELPVIVLTAQGGHEPVVQAMRAGAYDFFVKPASAERIGVGLRNALKLRQMTGEVKRLTKSASGELTFEDMIASAPVMAQVVSLGQRAAKSNIPVLITGESGVGKELVARAIQGASNRAGRPFITVNCGAIPENLVESTLFGHKKGSFTGATSDHQGKFKEADGGTLFLDEVGELPLDMQVKLLRALQEGEIDPVGAKHPIQVDVRIVSATNRDLASQVRDGAFREDLFYRLNVFPIEVPPLRERREDIPALVDHFIQRFNVQEGREIKGCLPETTTLLQAFDWKGNVRQLENAVFRAVILAEGDYIAPADFPHLPGAAEAQARAETNAPGPAPTTPTAPAVPHDMTAAANTPVDAANTGPSTTPTGSSASFPVELLDESGHLRELDAIERDLIAYAIEAYGGQMSEVSRRLGIGRSTLYRKVREHGLDVTQAREAS